MAEGTKRRTPIDLELESRLIRARDMSRPGDFERLMDEVTRYANRYQLTTISKWSKEEIQDFFEKLKGCPTNSTDFMYALERKRELGLEFEVNPSDYKRY